MSAEPAETASSHVPLGGKSRIALHPLAVREEDGQVIVGRIDTGEFVALPPVGRRAVELLGSGLSLEEASGRLSAEVGDEVDLESFAADLLDLGFVATVDGLPVGDPRDARPSLAWLRPEHVRWIFSRPVAMAWAVLVAVAAATLTLRPGLLPAPGDFFWSSRPGIVVAVNTLVFVAAMFMHELAHLAAARSLGVPARIAQGTRLTNLVAQTDVTGIWAVPRRRRYRVYLAGMVWDSSVIAACILLLAWVRLPATASRILAALVVMEFLSMVWQCAVFMRTDLYFVLLDLLRARNLYGDAVTYLRWRLSPHRPGSRRGAEPLVGLPAAERHAVRIYAWFMLAGSAAALGAFAVYTVPIVVGLLVRGVEGLAGGVAHGDVVRAVDGALALLAEGGWHGVLVAQAWRKHQPKLQRPPTARGSQAAR